MNIKKITPWKFILGILVILCIPTIFVFSLERYTTSNEDFCLTCHYEMWGEDFLVHSTIHPDTVRCPQCHANKSEIIPKNFSADPERVNPNCVRCHPKMFKKNDGEGFKYNVMKINIPHKFHLQEVGALCTDCHFNVKHDKFRPVTNRPRMEVCFECHEENTTECSTCHQRGADQVLAALPKTDVIRRQECEACHEGFASRPLTFYGLNYPHETHLKQSLACQECHSNTTIHGQIIKTREECMQCHHQDRGKECTECHTFENHFRNGTAIKEIKGTPDAMADTVTCDVCHEGATLGHSRAAVLGTCSMCHEEPGLDKKVDDVQQTTEAAIQLVQDMLERSKTVAQGLSKTSQQEVQTLIERGETILKTLKQDRSLGFHNAAYSSMLANDAEEKLGQVISWQESQAQP